MRAASYGDGHVGHQHETGHFLYRDSHDHVSPAADGRRFSGADILVAGLFQTEYGVQIEAHKIVLKLCRLGQCA